MNAVLDYTISLVYRIIRLIDIILFSKYQYKNYQNERVSLHDNLFTKKISHIISKKLKVQIFSLLLSLSDILFHGFKE